MHCAVGVTGTVCGVPCGVRLWTGKFWGQVQGASAESPRKGSVEVRKGGAVSSLSPEECEFADAVGQAGVH